MDYILTCLQNKGIPFYLESFSSLDRYFRINKSYSTNLLTEASLISLAQTFEDIQYPGIPFENAVLTDKNCRYIFRCVDRIDDCPPHIFSVQNLLYSVERDTFLDPRGIYRDLREKCLFEEIKSLPTWLWIMEAAKLVARYHYELDYQSIKTRLHEPSIAEQRELLVFLLSCRYSEKGFSLLHRTGFIEKFWPELFKMTYAQHSKEYHPEGNVWEHTLECLQYRKGFNLTLSMALLLHDIGKPVSIRQKNKPFKNHAELGTKICSSILRRLGFPAPFIKDVNFLIQYHMLPAALEKLPLYRTRKLMDSALFPLLLELYYADLSSTFSGPDAYYKACRIYKTYLKRKRNPYDLHIQEIYRKHAVS